MLRYYGIRECRNERYIYMPAVWFDNGIRACRNERFICHLSGLITEYVNVQKNDMPTVSLLEFGHRAPSLSLYAVS